MDDVAREFTTDDGGTTRAPLVLVADDDPVQRRWLQLVLERAGYRVVLACDGAEALIVLAGERPDVALIDAVMPRQTGAEVVAAIRAEPGLETLPAIIVSANDELQAKVDSFACGATDYLVKPVNAVELVARVGAQLRAGDVWTVRLQRNEGFHRAVHQELASIEPGPDPFESARRVRDRLPAELTCTSVIAVAGGRLLHLAGSMEDSSVVPALLALGSVASGDRQHVLRGAGLGCPVCGRSNSGGALVVTRLVSASACEVSLVSGCSIPDDPSLMALALVAADACAPMLCDQYRTWQVADADRSWVDDVIARRRFDVKYQPIVALQPGQAVAFEALARFPDGVDPESAFGLAARAERSVALELALVDEAIRRARALPRSSALHCNVSPLAVAAPELASILAAADRRVVIEITEHELIEPATVDLLRELVPPGTSIAIDDVGAGYAGLSLLLRLRPDEIKIDRLIVSGVHLDPARQALVAGLVRFALATGAVLIAEGIEHAEELRCLRSLGVEYGQGWLFAPALGIDEAATLRPFT